MERAGSSETFVPIYRTASVSYPRRQTGSLILIVAADRTSNLTNLSYLPIVCWFQGLKFDNMITVRSDFKWILEGAATANLNLLISKSSKIGCRETTDPRDNRDIPPLHLNPKFYVTLHYQQSQLLHYLPEPSLRVRHILSRQLYGCVCARECVCVQRDLRYGDFRSHCMLKKNSSM
jgi:hypothetical protein